MVSPSIDPGPSDRQPGHEPGPDACQWFFDEARIGVAVLGASGSVIYANRALRTMLDWQAANMAHAGDAASSDDRFPWFFVVESLAREGDLSAHREIPFQRPDGTTRWARLHASPIGGGTTARTLVLVDDISESKRTEHQLRASEAWLRLQVEALPAVAYTVTSGGSAKPLFISADIVRLLGEGARNAFYADDWASIIHPDDVARYTAAMRGLTGADHEYRVDYRARTDRGAYPWIRDEARLVGHGVDRPAVWQGVLIDVSRERRLIATLDRARNEAEQANEAKSTLISTVSHELRTPLNAIAGFASLLLDDAEGSLTVGQQEAVVAIARSSERLLTLINGLLDLARLEAGGIQLASSVIDLDVLLDGLRTEIEPLARDKALTVGVEIAADARQITGDEPRIRQILLNLIGNAVKFTKTGSVTISASTTGETIRIAVRDTGIGIDPAALTRIFDEFDQGAPGVRGEFGGSGLGLTIARNLAELHGGAIEVESTPGDGSTFTLVLPRHAPKV